MRILAIDDEPLFCEFLSQSLEELGFHDIAVAHSGPEALAIVGRAERPFQCFLVDIRMQPMDGLELVRRLRAMPDHRHTPIVMISALSEKSFIDEAFRAGANDYVTKPLEKVELKARMNMVRLILNEREQTSLLNDHIIESEKAFGRSFAFEDAILVPEARDLTTFAALENYALRLGNMRLMGNAAIGFHIENAEALFQSLGRVQFIDVLVDAADAIALALKSSRHILAYAGAGDFVAVVPKARQLDPAQLQDVLVAYMASLVQAYDNEQTPLPRIRVGRPANANLFSLENPTRILARAIRNARMGSMSEVYDQAVRRNEGVIQ